MKIIQSLKKMDGKLQKLSLKGYYNSLPEPTSPKTDFIREVAHRTGATETTVRNWCKYGMRPNKYEHVKVLVEITGIQEEDLWQD